MIKKSDAKQMLITNGPEVLRIALPLDQRQDSLSRGAVVAGLMMPFVMICGERYT
jgi:hypothetical protein